MSDVWQVGDKEVIFQHPFVILLQQHASGGTSCLCEGRASEIMFPFCGDDETRFFAQVNRSHLGPHLPDFSLISKVGTESSVLICWE